MLSIEKFIEKEWNLFGGLGFVNCCSKSLKWRIIESLKATNGKTVWKRGGNGRLERVVIHQWMDDDSLDSCSECSFIE